MSFDDKLLLGLREFGEVLSIELANDPEDVAFERDTDVDLLMRHLDQPERNSMLVVGSSGCGKTAILKQLFRKVGARRKKPWLVLQTSTSQIITGTKYLGEWQTRLLVLLRTAERAKNVAVYVTDVANLPSVGRWSKSDENMASTIVPFIERGEFVLIGECTPEIFQHGIEPYPWFKRLFTIFQAKPHDAEALRKVLRATIESRTRRFQRENSVELTWADNTMPALIEFGGLYFPGTAPPGGAIQLLDHVVQAEKTTVQAARKRPRTIEVRHESVIRALESFTGIPARLLDDSKRLTVEEVREFFNARVLGQSAAVSTVVDLITLIKAGLTDPSRPLGVLLFVGPTGVGKTEMAKALAEFIFGSANRMIRCDMSEYKDYDSYEKLIGAPRAHEVAHAGSLLAQVRRQPFSVILLDEIEKAHYNVFDLLLQLFDDGRLTDGSGTTTNFTQSIVVMTSNLGSRITSGGPLGFGGEEPDRWDAVSKALEGFFRPELINRINNIVMFQPLAREHVRMIAQRELGQVLVRSGITRRELRVDIDPGVVDILADAGFDEKFGARPIKRAVERLALLPVARQLLKMTGERQPALLRLLPSGKSIVVSTVQDRQARKSETLLEGVTLADPIDGRKTHLKPAQVREELESLSEFVAALAAECRTRDLAGQKSSLIERIGRVDFWDDTRAARETMTELYRIERILEAVERVEDRARELSDQLEGAIRAASAGQLAQVAERIRGVRNHAETVRYSLDCRDRLDRCDAFVEITAVANPGSDVAGNLADMYGNWARRKGFTVRIANEELFAPKITRSVTLAIEGVVVYGMLRGEEGVHEFVLGKTSKEQKMSHFVNVRLLPIVEDADRLGEVQVESAAGRGAGLRAARYRASATAIHQPTRHKLSVRADLAVEEAGELARDLVLAQIRRREEQKKLENGPAAEEHQEESPIRRYVLRPSQSARDMRTGVVKHRLDDLWKGSIDEFLAAGLKARCELRPEVGEQKTTAS